MPNKKLILLLFLLSAFAGNSQNLVPNPSFENYKLCPSIANTTFTAPLDIIQRFCADWESVGTIQHFWVGGGGQYLNECANVDKSFCGIPQCVFAYQYAHSGKGMALIPNTYGGYDQRRMYYGVKLISQLKIGHRYYVSFFISLADSSRSAMNNIGVTFFTKKTEIIDTSNITSLFYPNTAHIYSKNIIEDKVSWVKIEGTFIADSAYTYMVVGNFFDYNKTTYKNLGGINGLEYPAYLIDDFTVEEAKKTISPTNKIICKGDSVVLNAVGSSTDYYWSFNKVDTISKEDRISLMVDTSFNIYLFSNFGIDSLSITSIDKPVKKIPTDTFLCKQYYINVDASANNNATYKWNTGNTSPIITIDRAGLFILETTTGSCYRNDTLSVTSCQPTIFVPNAFTPNGDEINGVFLPKGVQIYNYNLSIYNKWGQQVFQSNDIRQGWDGGDYPSDVYFYIINYTDIDNIKPYKLSGNISLLR